MDDLQTWRREKTRRSTWQHGNEAMHRTAHTDQNNDRLVDGLASGGILAMKSLSHVKEDELESSWSVPLRKGAQGLLQGVWDYHGRFSERVNICAGSGSVVVLECLSKEVGGTINLTMCNAISLERSRFVPLNHHPQ